MKHLTTRALSLYAKKHNSISSEWRRWKSDICKARLLKELGESAAKRRAQRILRMALQAWEVRRIEKKRYHQRTLWWSWSQKKRTMHETANLLLIWAQGVQVLKMGSRRLRTSYIRYCIKISEIHFKSWVQHTNKRRVQRLRIHYNVWYRKLQISKGSHEASQQLHNNRVERLMLLRCRRERWLKCFIISIFHDLQVRRLLVQS